MIDKVNETEKIARSKIGLQIVYYTLCVIGVLGTASLLIIWQTSETELDKKLTGIKDILSILLPVIGTWVGTVLAFYFSRENFSTAAQQTSDLVRQLTPEEKLRSIKAKNVWISMTDDNVVSLVLNKEEKEITLQKDIIELLNKEKRNRLPIMTTSGSIQYLIHRSMIDKYITEQVMLGNLVGEKTLDKLTLTDFLNDEKFYKISQSFGIVNSDATLIEVKQQMESIDNCSDVFATEGGGKDGSVHGWLTNAILQEYSKV